MGLPYEGWTDIIQCDLRMLLERLPGLEQLRWSDGTPFADEPTRDWITQQVSGNQPATWISTPVIATSATDDILALESGALAQADSDGVEAALAWLAARPDVNSGRQRWLLRLLMARVAEQYGKSDLAIHLLVELDSIAQQQHLSAWEPELGFEVKARLLKLLRQKAQRNDVDKASLAQRMAAPADEAVAVTRRPVGASSRASAAPAFIVLKLDATEPGAGPVAQPALRPLWPWLLVLMILLAGLFGWWVKESTSAQSEWLSLAVFSAAAPSLQAKNLTHLDNLVLFPPGRAELKPESTKVLVNSLIDIKAQPGWLIVITGHSDTSGDPERNRVLSRQRAEAVKQWMQSVGDIPDSCFVTQGKGAEQPIADNQTESGRRSNRRVDIQLVPSVGACTSPVH